VKQRKIRVSFAKRAVHGRVHRYADWLTWIRTDMDRRLYIGRLRMHASARAAGLKRRSSELAWIRSTEHDLMCGKRRGEEDGAQDQSRAQVRAVGRRRRRIARRGGRPRRRQLR
jgi:hypothetical protein